MGAFVPQSVVTSPGFSPVDNTKVMNDVLVGITPNMLFFVGGHTKLEVNGPGTLYLGIDDDIVSDNSGSLTVRVSVP
jgi:hypothetical protein